MGGSGTLFKTEDNGVTWKRDRCAASRRSSWVPLLPLMVVHVEAPLWGCLQGHVGRRRPSIP